MTGLVPRTNTESYLAAVVDRLDTVAARLDDLVALATPPAADPDIDVRLVDTTPRPDLDVQLVAEPAPTLARRRTRSPVAAPQD